MTDKSKMISMVFANGKELEVAWQAAHNAGVDYHKMRLWCSEMIIASPDCKARYNQMLEVPAQALNDKMNAFRAIDGWQRFALVKLACMVPTSNDAWDAVASSDDVMRDVMFTATCEILRLWDSMRCAHARDCSTV